MLSFVRAPSRPLLAASLAVATAAALSFSVCGLRMAMITALGLTQAFGLLAIAFAPAEARRLRTLIVARLLATGMGLVVSSSILLYLGGKGLLGLPVGCDELGFVSLVVALLGAPWFVRSETMIRLGLLSGMVLLASSTLLLFASGCMCGGSLMAFGAVLVVLLPLAHRTLVRALTL